MFYQCHVEYTHNVTGTGQQREAQSSKEEQVIDRSLSGKATLCMAKKSEVHQGWFNYTSLRYLVKMLYYFH